MKKVKYLLMTLLVGLVTLTGCEKKNSLSPEEAIKKAASNMQALESYKMNINMGIGMKMSGIAIDMDVKGDATYDMKNNTAKMTVSTNFAGQDLSVDMYMNLKDENGKVVTYTKSSDNDEWVKSVSDSEEVSPNVSDALIKSLSDNKKIKEVKADKDNYNYEMTIDADTFKSLMSAMGSSSELAVDPDSIKGDIVLSVSIDKETNNYSKLSIDMKDMMKKILAESDETASVELTKAEFVMTFSDYNKAGKVEIPSDVINNANDGDDWSFTPAYSYFDEDDYDKVLTCTYKEDNEEGTMKIGFNNDVAELAYTIEKYTFDSEEEAEEFYDEEVDEDDHVSIQLSGKTVTIEQTEDAGDLNLSYDMVKEALEAGNENVVCR